MKEFLGIENEAEGITIVPKECLLKTKDVLKN